MNTPKVAPLGAYAGQEVKDDDRPQSSEALSRRADDEKAPAWDFTPQEQNEADDAKADEAGHRRDISRQMMSNRVVDQIEHAMRLHREKAPATPSQVARYQEAATKTHGYGFLHGERDVESGEVVEQRDVPLSAVLGLVWWFSGVGLLNCGIFG